MSLNYHRCSDFVIALLQITVIKGAINSNSPNRTCQLIYYTKSSFGRHAQNPTFAGHLSLEINYCDQNFDNVDI